MTKERFIVRPATGSKPVAPAYQIYDTVAKCVVQSFPIKWRKENSMVTHGRALRICALRNKNEEEGRE
jgi:hypothetical protein